MIISFNIFIFKRSDVLYLIFYFKDVLKEDVLFEN